MLPFQTQLNILCIDINWKDYISRIFYVKNWKDCYLIDANVNNLNAIALADHWCVKGHILLCLEGELHTELKDGRKFILKPGMSYQVADHAEPHRSVTAVGATLFVVD